MNHTNVQRPCPRALLTEKQAIEIYICRKSKTDHKVSTTALSKQFNISPKAIRDIWNRRTWAPETQHLWTDDERPMIRQKTRKSSVPPLKNNNLQPNIKSADYPTNQPFPYQHFASSDRQTPCSPCDICIDNWTQRPSTPDSHPQLPAAPRPDTYEPRSPALEPTRNLDGVSGWLQYAPAKLCAPSAIDCGAAADEAAFAAAARDDPFHSDWPHW